MVRDDASSPGRGKPKTRRGRNPWTYQMLAFVDERKKDGQSWREIFQEWNATYPDHPYKTVPAMQRSFYQAGSWSALKPGAWSVSETWQPEDPGESR